MVNNKMSLTIGGKIVNLLFGFIQAKEFALDIAPKKLPNGEWTEGKVYLYFDGEMLSTYGFAKLIQFAHKNDCFLREIQPVVTLVDISNWVEESLNSEKGQKSLVDVATVWQESEYTKSWADLLKKNTIPTPSPSKKIRKTIGNKSKPHSGRKVSVQKK